ncbi:MAG: isoleucine--tRNA ligase [Bacteroidota bacterium]
MKYKEYKKLDFPAFEKEVAAFWKEEDIFGKSVSHRDGKPTFTFYEGPPSANGKPGIHHVISRTIKDTFCRYKTLKGFKVNRKGGWDTHGLPIELQVEKALGITKEDIGKKISVEDYNKACREAVMQFKADWDNLTEQIGYWVDLDNPYITYDNSYIETCWNLLQRLYNKGLLYKGYTIQPYSPAAGTGLSSHELNQPGTYKDVKDTTVVAQFKAIKDEASAFLFEGATSDVFFLAWTTTPWTLPSNTALTVGGKIEYAVVDTLNQYTGEPVRVILAEALMGKYFNPENENADFAEYKTGDKKLPFRKVLTVAGSKLAGLRYEQLLPYALPQEEGDSFKVIVGDFVTTEDGTGIVHTAPTFGADDMRVAKQNGIAPLLVKDEGGNLVPLVDLRGRFRPEMGEFAGEFVKEQYLSDAEKEAERVKQGRDKYLSVDERISIKLKQENRAFKVEKYEHTYPHCWRTDKPVLYYPLSSWFIKTTAVKDRLIELNKTINWKPESTGTGRFGDWLNNLVDWNLSRSRYWGTPLPIWRTEDGTEEICIGSLAELVAEIDKAVAAGVMDHNPYKKHSGADINEFGTADGIDLHRPYVDHVVLVSPSGKPMKREADLIDVWFDSGAMPYAQWHWPFENQEQFESNFPADFIAEGVDQTRGWFFTLHALGVMLFDSVAYKNVVANGLVLDKNGNKMSKRLGNSVDPFEAVSQYGADAVRWYMLSNSPPWDNLKFDVEGVKETQRKFFATLYNVYGFFALYANVDGFTFAEDEIPLEQRPEIDRWVLSLLNSLIQEVDKAADEYDPTRPTRAIEEFVTEHLSNWYVRLCRRRFWKGEYAQDKIAAYQTLYTCLSTVTKLMASFAPFYADMLFRDLNNVSKKENSQSVHLSDFPAVNTKAIDKTLEAQMQLAQDISSMVLSLRKKVNIKVRQPLQKILVPVSNNTFAENLQHVKDLILSEVNVKELEYLTDDTLKLVKKVKPNFKTLGAKLGQNMKVLAGKVAELTQDEIRMLESEGGLDIQLGEDNFRLLLADAEIISEDVPGWQVAVNGSLTVALDVNVSDELLKEGIAREFINRMQNLRKEAGFEVTDKIHVAVQEHPQVGPAIIEYKNYICAEILAQDLQLAPTITNGKTIDINEIDIYVTISKVQTNN